MSRILFSPVSTADPTQRKRKTNSEKNSAYKETYPETLGSYDGPLLHIVRHYKPKKVVIFLTHEMSENDRQDNRYEIMVKRVCPQCEIVKIYRDDIVEAHKFEIYDSPFEEEIRKLWEQHKGDEILINVSSGTPQMQASLYMLAATLPFPVNRIQVSTPNERSNHPNDYDIESEWNDLLDNLDDPKIKKRCKNVIFENARKRILKENIISHINNYDYEAALRTVKSAEGLFDKSLTALLDIAVKRRELISIPEKDFKMASIEKELLYPIQSDNSFKLFEYILLLQMKVERKEYADFARGSLPALDLLFKLFLKEVCSIEVEKWCKKVKSGLKLIRESIDPDVLHFMDNFFKAKDKQGERIFDSCMLTVSNMLPIILYYDSKKAISNVLKELKTLSDLVTYVRNVASHEIIGVDNAMLQDRMKGKKITFEEIMDIIRNVFSYICSTEPHIWRSYNVMNEIIKERIY